MDYNLITVGQLFRKRLPEFAVVASVYSYNFTRFLFSTSLDYRVQGFLKGKISSPSKIPPWLLVKAIRVGLYVLFCATAYYLPVTTLVFLIGSYTIYRMGQLYYTKLAERNSNEQIKDPHSLLDLLPEARAEIIRRLPDTSIVLLSRTSRELHEQVDKLDFCTRRLMLRGAIHLTLSSFHEKEYGEQTNRKIALLTLVRIVKAQFAYKEYDRANEVVEMTKDLAALAQHPHQRAELLFWVAKARLAKNDGEGAENTFRQVVAEGVVVDPHNPHSRTKMEIAKAKAFLKDFVGAEKIANELRDGYFEACTLGSIAREKARDGILGARDEFQAIIRYAKGYREGWGRFDSRPFALLSIAKKQAKVDMDGAKATLKELITFVNTLSHHQGSLIFSPEDKLTILALAGRRQAEYQDMDGAKLTLEMIQEKLQIVKKHDSLLATFAMLQAACQDIDGSLKTVGLIRKPLEKEEALIYIALCKIKGNDLTGAIKMREEIRRIVDQEIHSKIFPLIRLSKLYFITTPPTAH